MFESEVEKTIELMTKFNEVWEDRERIKAERDELKAELDDAPRKLRRAVAICHEKVRELTARRCIKIIEETPAYSQTARDAVRAIRDEFDL